MATVNNNSDVGPEAIEIGQHRKKANPTTTA